MARPLVIAHHLIWTAYGWWLPNDLRGSMSRFIASDVLTQLGDLHYGRKRIQPAGRSIRQFYEIAKDLLKFPLLTFTPAERTLIALAFEDVIRACGYTCYACAVMPDHVHLLIRKHKHKAEEMIANFQQASRERVRHAGERKFDHPVWGGPGWKVFLGSSEDIERTVGYIHQNPIKIGMAPQRWHFVARRRLEVREVTLTAFPPAKPQASVAQAVPEQRLLRE
jgi:REP element-mobilizing transposase RayT